MATPKKYNRDAYNRFRRRGKKYGYTAKQISSKWAQYKRGGKLLSALLPSKTKKPVKRKPGFSARTLKYSAKTKTFRTPHGTYKPAALDPILVVYKPKKGRQQKLYAHKEWGWKEVIFHHHACKVSDPWGIRGAWTTKSPSAAWRRRHGAETWGSVAERDRLTGQKPKKAPKKKSANRAAAGSKAGLHAVLHYKKGGSDKFYMLSTAGRKVTAWWGRRGTKGQKKTWTKGSIAAAQDFFDEKVAEKRAKGYRKAR